LVRQPDLESRPDWWPAAQSGPYTSEQYSASLTDGPREGSLDGDGAVDAQNIPAGSCEFQATKDFYDEIEQYFDSQLNQGSDN
jgi:hypothetical protein